MSVGSFVSRQTLAVQVALLLVGLALRSPHIVTFVHGVLVLGGIVSWPLVAVDHQNSYLGRVHDSLQFNLAQGLIQTFPKSRRSGMILLSRIS